MPKIAKILIIALSLLLVVLAVDKSRQQNKMYVSVFNRIYLTDFWQGGSGPGSDQANASQYISLLNNILKDPNYQTVVDLGCGDWEIMQHIRLPNSIAYHGYDVSTVILEQISSKYSKSNIHFHHTNNLYDFSKNGMKGDLLIVKDVLQHLPNSDVQYFINNILPQYRWALITNAMDGTEWYIEPNVDIPLGRVRPLLLQQEPFNLKNVEVLLEYEGPELKQVLLYTNPNAT